MAVVAHSLAQISPSPDVWTDSDVDDRLPFLLPATRIPRRGSIKAQQVLGLIAVTRIRSGRRASIRAYVPRPRSRSEERPRSTALSLDKLEDDGLSTSSIRTGPQAPKRNSLKAHQTLGIVTDDRIGRRGSQRTTTMRTRSRSEERPLPSQLCLGEEKAEDGPLLESETPVRPLSFIVTQDGDRSVAPLASPRGFRGSAYVNFSRPLSQQSPRPFPGGYLERDPIPHILHVARDDIGLPRTPSVANTLAIARPIFAKANGEEVGGDYGKHPYQRHRRSKKWTSLPLCLIRLGNCKRREPNTDTPRIEKKDKAKGTPKGKGKEKERRRKLPLTEDNLRQYEARVGSVPRPLNRQLLPTPLHSPTNEKGPLFLPLGARVDEKPLPTPPSSSGSIYTDALPPPPPKNPSWNETLHTPSVTPTLHVANMVKKTVNIHIDLFACKVCNEGKAPTAFPIRQCTSKCTHAPHTCLSCVQQWVSSCIQTKGWDQCICPECNETLGYEDVKFFSTPDDFRRYDELATRSALSKITSFYWCLSPECTSGQIHPYPLSTNPTFVCTSCSHTYCLNHPSIPYHSGLSCAEYDALLTSGHPSASTEQLSRNQKTRQEKEDEEMARQIGKRCPNAMCGWWIEKNEGCDHMTCAKCKFEFCWECQANFARVMVKGGKGHKVHCRYYG